MKLFQLNEVLVTGTKIIASNELMVPPNCACSNHSLVGGTDIGRFQTGQNEGEGWLIISRSHSTVETQSKDKFESGNKGNHIKRRKRFSFHKTLWLIICIKTKISWQAY